MSTMWKIVLLVLAAVYVAGSVKLVGGFQDIDVTDEGVQNALNYAVVKHNRESNAVCPSQVSTVVKAQRQLVAGFKYIITTEMARTACRGSNADAPSQPYTCEFTVWSRPWLNDITVLGAKC